MAELILVRPVHLPTLSFFVATIVLAAGCTSPPARAFFDPSPQLDGPYEKSLSRVDVRQITALAYTRRDINKPVHSIYATGPNDATVTCGTAYNTGDVVTVFKIRRCNGGWIILKDSVYKTEVIVTS